MNVLIPILLKQYQDSFLTFITAKFDPRREILFDTDKYIKSEQNLDRYLDYYILLQILYYHNDIDILEDLEKKMVEHDLIYWYATDEEADKRVYQLQHFKNVYDKKKVTIDLHEFDDFVNNGYIDSFEEF